MSGSPVLDGPVDGALLWWAIALLLAALPFLVVMLTCFTKLVVVLSIVRNAFGVSDVPPNVVILGVSLALSLPVMAPVASQVATAVEQTVSRPPGQPSSPGNDSEAMDAMDAPASTTGLRGIGAAATGPVRAFLIRHTDTRHRVTFAEMASALNPETVNPETAAKSDDLAVLIPAFLTTELTEAFAIGFLLLLPFVMIDLVVVATLTALGIPTLSPTSVALPTKLLLFVVVDGWHIITRGLLMGYA